MGRTFPDSVNICKCKNSNFVRLFLICGYCLFFIHVVCLVQSLGFSALNAKRRNCKDYSPKETLTVLQYSMHCLRCSKISAEHRMYYGQDCQNLVWVFYCTLKTYGLRYLLSGIKVVNLTTEQENQNMLIIGLCHGKQ